MIYRFLVVSFLFFLPLTSSAAEAEEGGYIHVKSGSSGSLKWPDIHFEFKEQVSVNPDGSPRLGKTAVYHRGKIGDARTLSLESMRKDVAGCHVPNNTDFSPSLLRHLFPNLATMTYDRWSHPQDSERDGEGAHDRGNITVLPLLMLVKVSQPFRLG